ncbi:DUF1906 domain-containing protein [Corynebacterium halotolerans]|uniref:Rv2525c-like glycoside hydrolase-like domain-containing protein n=1 Tax=Corynebacterium halotolerans YIM 70093 = DSM 44683 TaxID=1121362 RepID=M1MVS0_9CORY|nr:DUF1906 domain-containing protein [Corynebacterium halotolerans]AGF71839.1 hypothetical protein A605_04140 [Corynebacterium halotolerans YIM 70093 = DSM 44683]
MSSDHPTRSLSRRSLLRAAAVAVAAGGIGAAATRNAPAAHALGPVLGTVIDYSAGVPGAAAVRNAGHLGAVRYVSQRRPGAEWMLGKPVTLGETQAMAAHGLQTASVYQFGRAETADWKRGALGAAEHAPQAIALHKAAGGPTGRPIYVAIDDNPTWAQYTGLIRPYLQAFQAALSLAGYQTGVYGNYHVIDWAINDGIGEFFWMHDWGSGGRIHPRTTIHQLPIAQQRMIDGITVDINNVYAHDWGQWTPGQDAPNPLSGIPAPSSIPDINLNVPGVPGGSSISGPQIEAVVNQFLRG